MKKNKILPISATLLIILGLWVALIPFSRPLPGGEIFSFENTPEASCRSPIFGTFAEDSPSYDVYVSPKPKIGDPTINQSISCSSSCLLYTSPSPRDATLSRMPSSA